MFVIGVCGGSGSGKSTVSACLKSFGGVVLDADGIYHELTSCPGDCLDALTEAFGSDIAENGSLNRRKLGAIVFQDEKKRLLLNKISHAFVIREMDKRLQEAEGQFPFAVIDAPLLWEAGLDRRCDHVIAVVAEEKERVRRIVSRDGISPEKALARIHSQIPDEDLIRRCDLVIHNDGSQQELEQQCRTILKQIGLMNEKEK